MSQMLQHGSTRHGRFGGVGASIKTGLNTSANAFHDAFFHISMKKSAFRAQKSIAHSISIGGTCSLKLQPVQSQTCPTQLFAHEAIQIRCQELGCSFLGTVTDLRVAHPLQTMVCPKFIGKNESGSNDNPTAHSLLLACCFRSNDLCLSCQQVIARD